MAYVRRSPLRITLSVWRALFIREVLTRVSAKRAGWIWIMLEPMLMMGVHIVMWGVINVHTIVGINGGVFLLFGVLGFMTVQRTAMRGARGVKSNSSLFAYRQVLPVDTVLMRAVVEGCICLIIGILFLTVLGILTGTSMLPKYPGQAMFAFGSLWAMGLGLGLILSALGNLVPEIENMAEAMFRVLYFSSAVFYPLSIVPQPFRNYLLLSPMTHSIELLRGGFFYQLQAAQGVSVMYVICSTLLLIFFGLALQLRFSDRLVSE